jgi:N-acyl-D-aspartate/D-glutamate deacylase
MIDSARAAGLDITHDVYPYTASSTGSGVLFPQLALAGGTDSLRARVADARTRARIVSEMRDIMQNERGGGDLKRVQFRTVRSAPQYNGSTLADLAAARGLPPTLENGVELVLELQLAGGFSAIYHAMDEDDVIRLLQHPLTMIETDGDPVGFGIGYPHPRSYGAFPRVLARYVRELQVLTLEDAIHRMTALAADQINQRERGRIREGAFADITIFDAAIIQDRATYLDPHQYPVGIHHVLVNGVPVMRMARSRASGPVTFCAVPRVPPPYEPVTLLRLGDTMDTDCCAVRWRTRGCRTGAFPILAEAAIFGSQLAHDLSPFTRRPRIQDAL